MAVRFSKNIEAPLMLFSRASLLEQRDKRIMRGFCRPPSSAEVLSQLQNVCFKPIFEVGYALSAPERSLKLSQGSHMAVRDLCSPHFHRYLFTEIAGCRSYGAALRKHYQEMHMCLRLCGLKVCIRPFHVSFSVGASSYK
jgi:hypothetical protein